MNEKKSLILMVEDEEQVLNTNCRMLRRRGYDVRIAQTAAEACHQLEEYLPDLLILDIMLPDGNGLDICRRFREKTMNPVLFLTGKSDIRDRVEGLQQGGDYYLTNPYNFDEFSPPVRSPSAACGWIFRTAMHISIMPTQALPGPNSLCCVSLQKTRRRFFLQRSSTKRYGAAVQEQIPARYGGISLTSGPRSVPRIPMNMTLSRFMGRDIFLPAGKCLFFFTFPNIGICLLHCT